MKTGVGWLAATLGSLVMACAPGAMAQCGGLRSPGVTHSSWYAQLGQPQLLRASLISVNDWDEHRESAEIVGFWHEKFTSDGVSTGIPGGIPKGAPVDAGYSQWHSDGTEILNSGGRAPSTDNFCLGVWKQVGEHTFRLNHFTTSWDPTAVTAEAPEGTLLGPGQIQEEVTVSPDGNHFSGSFTIDQYAESATGKLTKMMHLEGEVTGTRITVNTQVQSIF